MMDPATSVSNPTVDSTATSQEDRALFTPLNPDYPDLVKLRDVLDSHNFNVEGIERTYQIPLPVLLSEPFYQVLWRTREETSLDLLVRLFLEGERISLAKFETIVEATGLEPWVECGLVRVDGSSVSAVVELFPFRGLWMTFDFKPHYTQPLSNYYVMGVASSTKTLSEITIRQPYEKVLDLGCGSGLQALLCSNHSEFAIGIDQNPRAINLAKFNAALNGITNVEFRQGDLFQPVEGEKFDLIVSNPPYVVSPPSDWIFRDGNRKDSEREGDAFCQMVVKEGAKYLNEGGYLEMLANWVHPREENWKVRLRGWFDDTECDAWVMQAGEQSSPNYANLWIKDTTSEANRKATFDQWMEYYESLKVDRISAGCIVMRKRSRADNYFCLEKMPDKWAKNAGNTIQRAFLFLDMLAKTSDEELLDTAFCRSPNIRLTQYLEPQENSWGLVQNQIRVMDPLPSRADMDSVAMALLTQCNGDLPVRTILEGICEGLKAEWEEVLPAGLAMTKGFLQRGLIWPPEHQEAPSEIAEKGFGASGSEEPDMKQQRDTL
ncbi:Hypothetical protein PBC10988_36640 [Planctomycetales bacterium 10988]|nr:Hypothetical protein PBC10988_36640 [Planctomycetales bacterium 10988]